MRWKWSIPLLLAVLLTSCGSTPEPAVAERTEELMGTFVSAKIYADSAKEAEAALDAAFSRAAELELCFSPTMEQSELNAVNRNGQGTQVSEDFADLLRYSLHYTELTGAAFDCTIGGLIGLWGIGTEDARVPEQSEIRECLLPAGNSTVSLTENGTVLFSDERVQLHFGAIAKGYIADEMKEVLIECGIKSGTLVLGGNVLTLGEKPDGTEWQIGITDPFAPEEIAATVRAADVSVVTSGNYERYFEENGVRYHHILNPETGYPADSGLASTTIIAASSTLCDALSTATYVLGAEEGMALIERTDGAEAIFITESGEILLSSGMEQYDFRGMSE